MRTLADQARYYRRRSRNSRRQVSLEELLENAGGAAQQALADSLPSPSSMAVRRERAVLLADALEKLSPDYREVFVLRNIEHIPFNEIAVRMGRSPGATPRVVDPGHAAIEPVAGGEGDMSADAPLPLDGSTSTTAEEAELAQVLESYLARLEAGAPADPDGLIAAHPELALPLRACLKVMHLARDLDESAGPPLHANHGPFPARSGQPCDQPSAGLRAP